MPKIFLEELAGKHILKYYGIPGSLLSVVDKAKYLLLVAR